MLSLEAFASLSEALIYCRKIAFGECHGYLPTNGDANASKKGSASRSETATTTVAVVRRTNACDVIFGLRGVNHGGRMTLFAA